MGKSLQSQRRGKGSHVFRSQRKGLDVKYNSLEDFREKDVLVAEIIDLFKESGRDGIIAKILLENGKQEFIVAAEGMFVGKNILIGNGSEIIIGNILPLSNIPEGCPIFNIEKESGDGGVLVKTTGSFALLVVKDSKEASIKLPSGKIAKIPLNCRATIGCVAGGERKEKPLIKSGAKFHKMKAKTKKHITVRGVAMNAASHPFGGSQHHPGKSKSTSRNAPPGRKVGAIASRRTGRRKK